MRVLISGGGIAGLTLAFWLQRNNHRVLLVERAPSLSTEGFLLDLFGASYALADTMGLLPELSLRQYDISRLSFIGSAGQQRSSIEYDQLKELITSRHMYLMRGDLERALYAKIQSKVELRFETTIEALQQDERKVRVKLSSGALEDVDLFVGTDKPPAPVKEYFAFHERFLGYRSASFVLDNPTRELSANTLYTLTEALRQVSVYPMRDGRLAALFVYKTTRSAKQSSGERARRELRSAFEGMGWIVPRILARLNEAELLLDDVVQREPHRWSSRVALIGDACHGSSLMPLHEASMSMLGAYHLAEEIGTADHLDGALARYEQRMGRLTQDFQRQARELSRWMFPSGYLSLLLRNLLLRMLSMPSSARLIKQYLSKRERPSIKDPLMNL